jgi:DNA polymerase I-like protein with 3'-5' exonuclease and polymerase domains
MAIADTHSELEETIHEWAGYEFDIKSTSQLAKLFKEKGIPVPRKSPTALMQSKGKEGNPNLDKEVLTSLSSTFPICKTILDYRHYDTLESMFLVPYLELHVGGRLHCNFNPLRSDDYGTVSGRFSSTKPNLQQVPASDDEDKDGLEALSGKIIRKLFIPEDDCEWIKADYSQIEYRIQAHYAVGPGSEELRAAYNNDPTTDYHQRIVDITGVDRRTAKRLNFGASYGMGIETTARKFGWTMEEAETFIGTYHENAPYVRATRKRIIETAERRGYIFTLLGRKARVHPSRSLHSMPNRLMQGSSADIMKKGMLDSYRAGVFNVLKPHLTVHDEMDCSKPRTKEGEEAKQELKRCMEKCVSMRVPVLMDIHAAKNWAEAD